jgi:RNA polymerase sigma-70 factor (ECF subfamily)
VSLPPQQVKQLIRRSQQGDAEALARLYAAFAPAVYRYIAFRAPASEVEDLTAEVFLKMVEGLPSYQITEVPFEVWLYRIAAARITDYYRKSGRYQETELNEEMPFEGAAPDENVLDEQERAALMRALHQLSDEQQNVLVLRFVERKSHEEVARILDKSVTAIKSIQHRALIQLAKLMGAEKQNRHYLRGGHA